MTNNVDAREHALLSVTGRTYIRATAIEIVRAIEAHADDYANKGGTLRDFLRWSLAETLALSFLLLLDEYGIGKLITDTQGESKNRYTFET